MPRVTGLGRGGSKKGKLDGRRKISNGGGSGGAKKSAASGGSGGRSGTFSPGGATGMSLEACKKRSEPTYFDVDGGEVPPPPQKQRRRAGRPGADLSAMSPTSQIKVMKAREKSQRAYKKKQAAKQKAVPLALGDSPTKPFRDKAFVKDAAQARRRAVGRAVQALPKNPA